MQIEPPLPRMPEPLRPTTQPVTQPALTKGMGAASQSGVIVTLSADVRWMQKNGLLR